MKSIAAAIVGASLLAQLPAGGWQPPCKNGVCRSGSCKPAPATPSAVMPRHAVVRIVVDDGGGVSSMGTGVIVAADGTHAWILTVAHNIRDRRGGIIARLADRRSALCTVVLVDTTLDLVVLKIKDLGVKPAQTATTAPAVGATLEVGGLGRGAWRWRRGRFLGRVSPRSRPDARYLDITAETRQGDSGGPVVDTRGVVVGILTTGDGRTCQAVPIARYRASLAKVIPPWRLVRRRPIVRLPRAPKAPKPAPPPKPALPDTGLLERIEELEKKIEDLESQESHEHEPIRFVLVGSEGKVVGERIVGLGETLALPVLITSE